jgi:hypothetical protein
MSLIKQHIAYLKDNPEKYWFKRKLFGYGWTPATRAGWLVVSGYVLFLLGVIWYAEISDVIQQSPNTIVIAVVGATVLLLAVCWKTGEPLQWQWGRKNTNR